MAKPPRDLTGTERASNKVKIFYLGNAASVHVQRWTKYFTDNGHEVHVISRSLPGANGITNVPLHLLPEVRPHIKVITHALNLVWGAGQVKALIKKSSPDIIHGHSVSYHSLIGALTGFHPYLLTVWGSDVLVTPKASRLGKAQVKFALAKADIVLTTSQYLKRYVGLEFNLPDSKVVSLPWGVDLKIFTKGYETETKNLRMGLDINDGNFVILSPRHLRQHYRIENIIQAMPYILAKHANVTLIILQGTGGESQFENQVDRLIEQLGIEKNVRLIRKHLSSQEMAVAHNACDAFISIPKTDGFASCVMEGMACGTVPIVANLEVYRQYLNDENNALFVNPDDAEDIAAKVIYCIEHPELKQGFYEINRRIIEENEDWAQNASKLEELYQNLLDKNKDATEQSLLL